MAPPSRQPADPRAAIGVLIEDLARAVASERVSNLRALYPAISPAEVTGWRQFFAGAQQLTAEFTIAQLTPRGGSATAQVKAVYRFLPRAGGAQREDRPNYEMRFTKTINGWRVASVKETR